MTWGTNASIMAIDLTTNAISTVLATTLSNCDGITKDGCGFYYVTSWGNNKLNKFNNTLTGSPTVVPGTLSSPADIDCKNGSIEDVIGITNNSNTLSFVTVPKPAVIIVENSNVLSTTTTFQTYQWYLDSVLISGANSQSYTATVNGSYTCVVTEGNCDSTSNVYSITTLSNPNFENNNAIVVYPNPSSDVLNITGNEFTTIEYTILNMLGQEVFSATKTNVINNKVTVPISNLEKGNYIIQIKIKDTIKKVKFTKM